MICVAATGRRDPLGQLARRSGARPCRRAPRAAESSLRRPRARTDAEVLVVRTGRRTGCRRRTAPARGRPVRAGTGGRAATRWTCRRRRWACRSRSSRSGPGRRSRRGPGSGSPRGAGRRRARAPRRGPGGRPRPAWISTGNAPLGREGEDRLEARVGDRNACDRGMQLDPARAELDAALGLGQRVVVVEREPHERDQPTLALAPPSASTRSFGTR